jgi:hypothetical protein
VLVGIWPCSGWRDQALRALLATSLAELLWVAAAQLVCLLRGCGIILHRRTWRTVKAYTPWSAFEDLLADGLTQLERLLIALLLPLALHALYLLDTMATQMLAGR